MRCLTLSLVTALTATALGLGGCRSREATEQGGPITSGDVAEAVVTPTRHFQAQGEAPVYQVLPGQAVFAEKARTAAEPARAEPGEDLSASLFSDEVRPIEGEIFIEAIDRVGEDEAVAGDGNDQADVRGWFNGVDGTRYEFQLARVVPAEAGARIETHFGGVATDTVLFGDSGLGTRLLPKMKAACAIFGYGTLKRDGKELGEVPMHIIVGTRTRAPHTGRYLGDYDTTRREVDEVHLLIQPRARLDLVRPRGEGEGTDVPAAAPREGPGGRPEEAAPKAGEPKEAPAAAGGVPAPGFHVVWEHANISFRPY